MLKNTKPKIKNNDINSYVQSEFILISTIKILSKSINVFENIFFK